MKMAISLPLISTKSASTDEVVITRLNIYKAQWHKGQAYFTISPVLQPKDYHQMTFSNRVTYSDLLQTEDSIADLVGFGCQCEGWTGLNNQLDGETEQGEEIKDELGASITDFGKQQKKRILAAHSVLWEWV